MTDALTAGELDGLAEHTFRYGACAGLAIAIHDLTGWPLVKITDACSVYRDAEPLVDRDERMRADAQRNTVGMGAGGLHWMVLHPSGKLLDVTGLHDAGEIVDLYDGEADDGQAAIGVTDREDAIDEYVDAKGEPVSLELCGTFADAVLARAQAR